MKCSSCESRPVLWANSLAPLGAELRARPQDDFASRTCQASVVPSPRSGSQTRNEKHRKVLESIAFRAGALPIATTNVRSAHCIPIKRPCPRNWHPARSDNANDLKLFCRWRAVCVTLHEFLRDRSGSTRSRRGGAHELLSPEEQSSARCSRRMQPRSFLATIRNRYQNCR